MFGYISLLDINYFIPGELDESASQVSLKSRPTISSHLELLHVKFVHYIPAENMAQLEENAWIRSIFPEDINKIILFAANETQMIDFLCNENPKGVLREQIFYFWLNAATLGLYPGLSDVALSM